MMNTAVPYSPAFRAGDFVFISGQIGIDANGELADGFDAQFRQAIANLRAILEDNGLGPEHIAKTTVFLTDFSDYPIMNDIYGEVMYAPYPARAALGVLELPRGASVEIEAIAYAGKK